MADGAQNVGYAMLPVTLSFDGITKDIADKLGVPLKVAATRAGTDAGAAIAAGVDQAKGKVESATAKVTAAFKRVEDQTGKVRVAEAQLQALRDKGITDAGKLAAAEEKVAKAQRDLTDASNKHKNATGSLTDAERKLADAQKNVADESKRAGDAARKSADGNGLARKAADQAGRAYDNLTSKAKAFGKTIAAGVGFGAGFNIAGITSSLMEMGDTFAQVNKTIAFSTGATGDRLDQLNDSVRNIARDSPKAMGDIANALSEVAKKTQLTGQPLEDLTKRMIKLDTLGQGVDIGGLTQAMRAFGVPAGDMSTELDGLFKVARATGVGLQDLAGTAFKGAPQFKQFGFSLQDTAMFLGTLQKAGINGEQVTVGLNKAMINLAKNGGDVKQGLSSAVDEIGRLIKSGNDAAATEMASKLFGTKSAGQFVAAIKTGTLSLDQMNTSILEGQDGILDAGGAVTTMSGAWQMFKNNVLLLLEPVVTKIFSSMQDGIKWFRGEGVEAIRKVGDTIKGAWNSEEVQSFVRQIADTFQAVWPKVTGFLQTAVTVARELAPVVGPILTGALSTLTNVITGVVDGISSMVTWIKENKTEAALLAVGLAGLFGPAIMAGIAAGGVALLGWLKNIRLVTGATKLWATVTRTAAIAMKILKLAFVGNPLGLLVLGITAVAAGLVMLWKRSETFRNIVTGAWNGIKSAAGAVVSWFTDTAWPWLQKVWDGISDGVGTMIGFVRDHWRTIVSIIGGPIGLVVALVTKYWDQIKGAFSAAWDGIKVIVDGGLAVFRGIGTVLEWLWQNVFVRVWDGIKAAIGFAWDGIKFYVDAGLAVFRGIGTVLEWLWQNVVVRVWDGIKNAIATAWGLIQPVIEAFRAGIEIAGNVIAGVWNGLVDTVKSVGTGIRDGFMTVVDFVGGLPGKIAEKARGMWDGIKNAFRAAVNWIIDGWNRIEFKIPGFKMGPVKFDGFTLGLPDIPRLAGGGRIADMFKRAVGIVRGPGGPTDDQVPSLLSNRESVNTAASTSKYWPLFEKLNRGVPLHKALLGMVPAFSTGGVAGREPYGLPAGSSGSVDVPWVQDIERQFGVEARTYAGHQEKDGLNKGIDWFGPTANLQRLAEHLRSIRGDLEQVIWLNPETGEKIGVADGELVGPGTSQPGYYGNDWADHSDHVHTRQSYSFAGTTPQSAQPVIYDSTSGTEGGSSDSQPPTAPAAMSLGEWIGRRIFGNWTPPATSSGSSSAPSSSAAPSSGVGGSSLSAAASSAGSSSLGSVATAAGTSTAPPKMTKQSSRDEIARAIYLEARRRGYSHEKAVAIVATGLQESGLDPEADGGDQGIGGAWGIFQQGAHYGPDRKDPNVAMAGFFDRMERTGGSKSDRDIWQQIVGIQQHDGEFAGTAGDSKYMGEIKSQLDAANKLVGGLENTAAPSSGAGASPTVPLSAGGVDPKKLRDAKDKADDAETAAAVARTKLAEIEGDPKAKESAKEAQRAKVAKLEREAQQAKDDLAALEQTPAGSAAPATSGTVDAKKLRDAKDKADDAETAAATARTRLAELEADPKAKESAKQAQRAKVAKLEREAQQAKDDLAALERTPATSGGANSGTSGSSDKPQIIAVIDGQNVDVSELADLSKILAGGVLETFGLDGSWLPNPAELGVVKMANALLSIKFTEPAWMSGQGEAPPWIDKRAVPFSTKPMAPQTNPQSTPAGIAAGAFGLDGIGALVGSMPQRNVDASININNPQGDPNDIAKRVRRLLPDQRTRLHGAVPVGR
ncbi:tape measure protein [Gordonia phage GrandSlam]|nr:tape measure protein [Gordonia phage Chop]UXL91295.1 tape measure protein [Gordonia phage GrandSlam]